METGWIKLYRCSIGSRVFNNEGLLKVWIWCLLKANHSTQWVNLKTGRGSIEVECKDGQFIFGRNTAAKELNMDGSTVWKRMQKLKNMENLTIESNKQYSIISIMNWHTYQTKEKESNSQGNKQVTSKEQASNTNKNVKNDKNEKKVSKGKTSAPESFTPTDNLLKFFDKETYWKENYQDLIDACLDHFRGNGEQKKDWEATIRSWCRKHKDWNPKNYESIGKFTCDELEGEFDSIEEMKERIAEEASKRTCAGDLK